MDDAMFGCCEAPRLPHFSGGNAETEVPNVPWNVFDGGDAAGTSGTPYYTGGNAWTGAAE